MKFQMITVLFLSILIASCDFGSGGREGGAANNVSGDRNAQGGAGSGQGAINGEEEGGIKNLAPAVEIRNLINPFDGSYQTKVSIPKNYRGHLYLSGLNFSSFADKLVKVKFYVGRDLTPITIDATLGRGVGLVPDTNILVLDMHLVNTPFDDVTLPFDLYDYNTYDSADVPVTDPLDKHLYCRGLRLTHDITFKNDPNECVGVDSCSFQSVLCDSPNDECKYAFTKIRDAGLYNSNGEATIPEDPQIDLTTEAEDEGQDYLLASTNDTALISEINGRNLRKCLPDNGALRFREVGDYFFLVYDINNTVTTKKASFGSSVLSIDTSGENISHYTFKGPYLSIGPESWEMKPAAAFSKYGVYGGTLASTSATDTEKVNKGILSLLFPRAGTMELGANTTYLGSSIRFPEDSSSLSTQDLLRIPQTMTESGSTLFMDGCNMRASNANANRGETMASCNIVAFIEIITLDDEGNEEVLASTSDVKLQITKSSSLNIEGKEVLFDNFKSCSGSKSCAVDECCFNGRCWGKELVSQCLEEAVTEGNLKVGDACTTDLECSSLCCDNSKKRCAVHNPTLDPPVYCSKPPGSSCIAKEWCRRDNVKDCRIVRTSLDQFGAIQCALRCFNRLENGLCVNGICSAPLAKQIPFFDLSDPARCAEAEEPPLTL
ncbi:hypothetical protein OAB57_01200 [Bacteriovoracaceae bacterium]|nr:hypothetical protein [Bacteriovoracaceae bacterium]